VKSADHRGGALERKREAVSLPPTFSLSCLPVGRKERGEKKEGRGTSSESDPYLEGGERKKSGRHPFPPADPLTGRGGEKGEEEEKKKSLAYLTIWDGKKKKGGGKSLLPPTRCKLQGRKEGKGTYHTKLWGKRREPAFRFLDHEGEGKTISLALNFPYLAGIW